MKDRLEFVTTTLHNGVKVYSHYDNSVAFAHVSLITPVGSAHNHGKIIPGSFHYLEHLLMKRSELYPQKGSLKEKASLLGGRFGAGTWFGKTSYDLTATTENLPDLFKGLTSHFFNPIILQEDVIAERGIIANERNRKSPFYPGTNERTQYLDSQWINDELYSVNQVFGSDEDFKEMTVEYFTKLHSDYYRTNKSYCVVAGNFDLDSLCNELSQYELIKDPVFPIEQFMPRVWNKRNYHEVITKETNRFEYYTASLFPVDMQEAMNYLRLLSLSSAILTDYSYGVLMQWLRHEKNWCYEISTNHEVMRGGAGGGFMIPLNSKNQVFEVRKELLERVFDGLSQQDLLEKARQHKKNLSVFWYQTMESRINSALKDLHIYGSIETEREYFDSLDAITTDSLLSFFNEKLKPNFGELLFVPGK